MSAVVCVWRPEDNVLGSITSFHPLMTSKDGTGRSPSSHSKSLYPLSLGSRRQGLLLAGVSVSFGSSPDFAFSPVGGTPGLLRQHTQLCWFSEWEPRPACSHDSAASATILRILGRSHDATIEYLSFDFWLRSLVTPQVVG